MNVRGYKKKDRCGTDLEARTACEVRMKDGKVCVLAGTRTERLGSSVGGE